MKEIIVYADWVSLPTTMEMGVLRAELIRGEEIFSFTYSGDWLNSGYAQDLDPDLKLFSGPEYLYDDKPNFGLFLDSSPDRWGRTLMQRRAAIIAKKEDKPRKKLLGSDYLLGLQDETRMGALRFKLEKNENYLNDSPDLTTPPFTSIRELEQAVLIIESDEGAEGSEAEKWLTMLWAPGSSLGGARPKANVIDPNGHLWIAKFPSRNDQIDSGGWEYIVNRIGVELGLNMAESNAGKFSQKYQTYLTKRFDRTENGGRIHFASAMTLLGYKDGANQTEGVSYLEIVDFIEQYGAAPDEDIKELWKRIVFSIAISNTDDHLRNHGFLLTPKGWKLSPAYDINLNIDGIGLSLNIDEVDNSLDFNLALSVCEFFRWNLADATAFLLLLNKNVESWRLKAKSIGIPKAEQEFVSSAFNFYSQ